LACQVTLRPVGDERGRVRYAPNEALPANVGSARYKASWNARLKGADHPRELANAAVATANAPVPCRRISVTYQTGRRSAPTSVRELNGGTERTVACQAWAAVARQNAQGARPRKVADRWRVGYLACTERPPR
jgi:hypothetical protein